MKKTLLIAVALCSVAVAACEPRKIPRNEQLTQMALENAGYKDIQFTQPNVNACEISEVTSATGYTATNPNGKKDYGTVCEEYDGEVEIKSAITPEVEVYGGYDD
jgi:hypothetical protein